MGPRPLLAACAVLVPSLALAGAVLAPSQARRAYDRSLGRAVERAQADLERRTDLFVDHSSWDDPWVFQSDHYEVRSTQTYAFTRDIALGLETMLGHFQAVLGTDYAPAERQKVWIFPDLDAYRQIGDDVGAEHSSFYGSFWATGHAERPIATYYLPNYYLVRQWITHAAAHQFVAQAFPNNRLPDAMAEGVAAYFALYWDFPGAIRSFEGLRDGGRLLPLANLLRTPTAGFTDRPDQRLLELGMLASYLLNYREDTRTEYEEGTEARAPFADYVRELLRGGNAGEMPIHLLLTADLAYLEEEFRAYDFSP